MPAELVRSKENAQVRAARQLLDARARRAQRRLLVEGARLLRDAWEAGFRPESCFFDPAALGEASPGATLLRDYLAAGVRCLGCTPAVFATLSDTVTPQGIAAVLPTPDLPPPAHTDLLLVLDAIREPGNAGTLLRAAEAAGTQVALFGPQSVDAYAPKVIRSAMGAHFRLAIRECTTWEAVQEQCPQGMTLYVAAANASLHYDDVDWSQPSALIVGNEAAGAGKMALKVATPISIPMQGATESLNAAVAGAVILFEAARQRRRVA